MNLAKAKGGFNIGVGAARLKERKPTVVRTCGGGGR